MGISELCVSYCGLSTVSHIPVENEDYNRHCLVWRLFCVNTDSLDDLSRLGRCRDPQNCEVSYVCEGEDTVPTHQLSGYEVDTDIRQIVNFFERNVGSGRSDGP